MILRGIYVATVTPWKNASRDDVVDENALAAHLEMLLAAGVAGLCVAGSTGEFPRLERAARLRLFEITETIAAGRVPVLFGIGAASLDKTLSLIDGCAAARLRPAGIVVAPPYY